MEEQIVFGDEMMPVKLPDNIQSAPPGLSTTLSAVDNIEATVRQALLEPLGRPLLSEMAKPNWRVTIASETRQAVLALMKSQLKPRREIINEKADIVLYGIPNWSPYAAFSVLNPLLTLVSTGLGYFGGVIEAMGKPDCTVILASPCPDQWNHIRHPTHREIWQKILPHHKDPSWQICVYRFCQISDTGLQAIAVFYRSDQCGKNQTRKIFKEMI